MKRIITISREFGSGGRTIGKEVARRLDYNFFDRELVEEVAKRSGFSQDFIEENGEYANARSSLLFYWATAKQHSMENLSMHDQIYIVQTKVIEELAETGNCVIVGRCADYVLREQYSTFDVFVSCATARTACTRLSARIWPAVPSISLNSTARRTSPRKNVWRKRTRSARSIIKTTPAATGARRRTMIFA